MARDTATRYRFHETDTAGHLVVVTGDQTDQRTTGVDLLLTSDGWVVRDGGEQVGEPRQRCNDAKKLALAYVDTSAPAVPAIPLGVALARYAARSAARRAARRASYALYIELGGRAYDALTASDENSTLAAELAFWAARDE